LDNYINKQHNLSLIELKPKTYFVKEAFTLGFKKKNKKHLLSHLVLKSKALFERLGGEERERLWEKGRRKGEVNEG